MAQPYDVTSKDLIRQHPKDWIDFLDLPGRSVTLIDADLSTVTTDADKILKVDADPPYIAHLELQSKYKTDDSERFLVYNVLTGRKTNLLHGVTLYPGIRRTTAERS